MPAWLALQRRKAGFFLTLYDSINDITHPKLSVLHLSGAIAILVVDCCQFDPSWIFGLKTELMASADLIGGTTEQSCLSMTLYDSINVSLQATLLRSEERRACHYVMQKDSQVFHIIGTIVEGQEKYSFALLYRQPSRHRP